MPDPARIRRLFLAVCDLDPDRQAAVLDRETEGDPDLRREVELLLRGDRATSNPLDSGLIEELVSEPEDVPERIGPFTVVSVLGRGAQGIVYLARQKDPDRHVALKLLRPALDSSAMMSRFRREVSALGRLQHPGIAQVFESGTIDVGGVACPYFAMEYVEGEPVHAYCNGAGLTPERCLELLARIADAVQHAHDRGIVHRDLKPTNILVDGRGQPKVLDFGVARLVRQEGVGQTRLTETGMLIGTLHYMSPEQVQGRRVDARSDVYALGVIGYELVAGRLPYDFRGHSIAEVARTIAEDPVIPLTRCDRRFRGDMETILHTALEKDVRRRYQTAGAFAEDVRRFLRDEPILARPPSAAYRARKFARRHRGLVFGVAAGFAMLLSGLLVALWQWRTAVSARNDALAAAVRERQAKDRALAARDDALREADRATRVLELFRQTMVEADPFHIQGDELSLVDAIDKLAERLDQGLGEHRESEARLHELVGDVYVNRGRVREGLEHLRRSLAILEATYGPDDRRVLSACQSLANALQYARSDEEAVRLFDRILAGWERYRDEDAVGYADALADSCRPLVNLARTQEAIERLGVALPTLERELGDDATPTIDALLSLSNASWQVARYEDAEAAARRAVEASTRLYGAGSPMMVVPLNALALALERLERLEEACAVYERMVRIAEETLGPTHPDTLRARGNWVAGLYAQGEIERVARELRPILSATIETNGDSSVQACVIRINLSTALRELGKIDEAFELSERACRDGAASLPADHFQLAMIRSNHAGNLIELGRFADAMDLLEQAVPVLEARFGAENPTSRRALERLHDVYVALGEREAAAALESRLSRKAGGD